MKTTSLEEAGWVARLRPVGEVASRRSEQEMGPYSR
jgi:hypothetical protein